MSQAEAEAWLRNAILQVDNGTLYNIRALAVGEHIKYTQLLK
jgi:hypothetical protein